MYSNIAPNDEIELAIINYCLYVLKLEMGDFWYKWIQSNSERNQTLRILCETIGLTEQIRKTFFNIEGFPEVEKIHSIHEMDYKRYKFELGNSVCYDIHFKTKDLIPGVLYKDMEYEKKRSEQKI